jgi:L-threonylcarbamoyladenylate synthase
VSLSDKIINKAVATIKAGGVVVFPTETAYGLAADATNAKAVAKVFVIKGRTKEKSFPLIVVDLKMAEKYAVFSPAIKKLVKKYWPGALTVVVSLRHGVKLPSGVVQKGTIAVRASSHTIARTLSRRLGRPIVSTSANLSGRPTCYSARAVKKQLGDRPDDYLDAGRLPHRRPSTIITEKDGKIIVLREGSIKI